VSATRFEASLAELRDALFPLGEDAWAVGGGVRDALLGRPVADVDVAIAHDAQAAATALARSRGAQRFSLSREFGSWRVHGGRLPFDVDITPIQGESLDEDLGRRDFTVNAIAAPVIGGPIVDPLGGIRDLKGRRMRLVSSSALSADPVRLLRLARQAHQLGFWIDEEAMSRAREDASSLWSAPGERLRDELGRILRLDAAAEAIVALDRLGVLGALVPELEQGRGLEQSPYHHRDVLGHTLEVIEGVATLNANPELVFRSRSDAVARVLAEPLADDLTHGQALLLVAIMHDAAKPATRAVQPDGRVTFMRHDIEGAELADRLCRSLKTSNRLREFVVHCVRWHLPLGFLVHHQPLSLRRMFRYLKLTAPYEVDIIVLSAADRLATQGPRVRQNQIDRHLDVARQMLAADLELKSRDLRPLIPGDELAAHLGRDPGPWLGDVLDALEEEQAVGAISTPDGAVTFAERWLGGGVPERRLFPSRH
jgi:poly(A) polymerase